MTRLTTSYLMKKHAAFPRRFILAFIIPALLVAAPATFLFAQDKYSVQQGSLSFTSNAELELIRASSRQIQGLIDGASNKFAFSVDIQSFRGFNSELQREHFNEKYMESDLYPRAQFSGKIIEAIDFSVDQSVEVRAKGELDIHGQKQMRIIKAIVTIRNGLVLIEANFLVPLSDHNILIPRIVSQKIATEIEVEFKASMAPLRL